MKKILLVYLEWEKMKVGNSKSSSPPIFHALLKHDIEAASVDNPGYVATSSRNKMADKVWNVKLLHLSCRWFIFAV